MPEPVNMQPRSFRWWRGGYAPEPHIDVTPVVVTPQRAVEIETQARALCRDSIGTDMGWTDLLSRAMRPEEHAYFLAVWDTFPGSSCYMDAFWTVRNGQLEVSHA